MLKSLKLLADSNKLRILMLLDREPLSVAELQEALAMGQSTISTHLSQLKVGGLVSDTRSRKSNIYASALPPDLLALVKSAAAEVEEVAEDEGRLEHLLQKRRDHARRYFDELAGRFGKDYVPGRSWKALAEALLKVMAFGTVADLGAGEGTLAQLLAQRAEKVIAVDLSARMVAFAQGLALRNGLTNVEFRLGDIEDPPIDPATLDLAVLSQALHHAEHPQRAIDAAFRCLRPGGKIVVLDLLQHGFEEARELYADRWLGFSERDLFAMLKEAGFERVETIVADRENEPPHFQTLLGVGMRPV